MMPTNVELAKRIDLLEGLLKGNLDALVLELTTKIKEKLGDQGLGEQASLAESVQHMSDLFDEMKAKQVELISTNKALILRNNELEKKVADLEQYSRSNNVEIRGVPSTKGEDWAAIVQLIGEVSECPVAKVARWPF